MTNDIKNRGFLCEAGSVVVGALMREVKFMIMMIMMIRLDLIYL